MYNDLQPIMSTLAQTISHLSETVSSGTSWLMRVFLMALNILPPFLPALNSLKESGNTSLSLVLGDKQVSVPIIMSGSVLSMTFPSRCCLDLRDWKFMFKTRRGLCTLEAPV